MEKEELNPAKSGETPLEKVKEQQAKDQNKEVLEKRVDSDAEVPGGSVPSSRRKHPQRKM